MVPGGRLGERIRASLNGCLGYEFVPTLREKIEGVQHYLISEW